MIVYEDMNLISKLINFLSDFTQLLVELQIT